MKNVFLLFLLPLAIFSQAPYAKVRSFIDKKQYAEAEKLIFPYVESSKNDKVAIELLGDAYAYQTKWEKAIAQYKVLTNLDDKNANYHYKYGGALSMRALKISKLSALLIVGDIKNAFLKSAELDPKHIDTRWALVELYMTLPGIIGGSNTTSLKYANELETISKVDGYLAKGYIYEYANQPEKAEYYYKKAVSIGGSVTCFEKLATFYESQKQPGKAISTIEVSQSKHNRNALHYQLGKVAADYNVQLEKGERCLLKYIEDYTAADGVPLEWAYYRLAQIYKHKNDKNLAIAYINKALALRSDFKEALVTKPSITSM